MLLQRCEQLKRDNVIKPNIDINIDLQLTPFTFSISALLFSAGEVVIE